MGFIATCMVLARAQTAAGDLIAPAPAYYPRVTSITLNGSPTAVAVMERPNSTMPHRLAFLQRTSASSEVWSDISSVRVDTSAGTDLANGYIFQLPGDSQAEAREVPGPGSLLCAYRWHSGVGTAGVVYRIALSWSPDGQGLTWVPLANITQGATGVWEPMLYRHSADPADTVRVLYSAELTNGGEQDIVEQRSVDYGATWSSAVAARIHTPGSRNGMPGVVELPDTSLMMVFEGFWTGLWGSFTVNSARSFDAGDSWVQRQIVHAPAVLTECNGPGVPCCAGSPQIGMCFPNSTSPAPVLAVLFMSNENHPGTPYPAGARKRTHPDGGNVQGPVPWPGNAGIGLVLAPLDGQNITAPVNWTAYGTQPTFLPLLSSSALWPAVFLDLSPPHSTHAEGAAAVPLLRASYQTVEGNAALSRAGTPAATTPGEYPYCSFLS